MPHKDPIPQVLLLGATGRTGRHVLAYLLREGYTVHALVRDKRKVAAQGPGLRIFEGGPTDRQALSEALRGCDYAIGVLNVSRHSDFPWSRLRSPGTLLSDTLALLLDLTRENPLKKIVICSAWGAKETLGDLPAWFRWIIRHSNIGVAYRDHERQEDLLMASGLDFTIVRPTGLTNGREEAGIRISRGNMPKPNLTISRRSLARFLIRSLTDGSLSGQAVTISKG